MTSFRRWQHTMVITLSLIGLVIFYATISLIVVCNFRKLFLDLHGWSHRLAGAALLSWLVYGSIVLLSSTMYCDELLYDIVLGCLGLLVTLTAARDFPHKYVKNEQGQSGTLSNHAMVTQQEMIEHAFYQFLNLWQALYLHYLSTRPQSLCWERIGALFLVTSPWLVRHRFPVHSFSQNWKQNIQKQTSMETLLYRIKKGQYLFYKHVILHGVNLSQCLDPSERLVMTVPWRVFWLCLNTSYVMEFFLQSLVKRHFISQTQMLTLNRSLMGVASLAAIRILPSVRWNLAALSLFLNVVHRHHDVFNTVAIACVSYYFLLYSTRARHPFMVS